MNKNPVIFSHVIRKIHHDFRRIKILKTDLRMKNDPILFPLWLVLNLSEFGVKGGLYGL